MEKQNRSTPFRQSHTNMTMTYSLHSSDMKVYLNKCTRLRIQVGYVDVDSKGFLETLVQLEGVRQSQ